MSFRVFNEAYEATCSLLPPGMDSPAAKAMLMAIALQESAFEYRRQIGGPARGFWQFERDGGVKGVLRHPATSELIREVLAALTYDEDRATSYIAIEHNDVLACAYARLLLWTIPQALPQRGEFDKAWNQYLEAWRPGKPHRQTWNEYYARAWA